MLPDNVMVYSWACSLSAVAALWQGQRGFFTPRAVSPFLLNDGSAGATSFYDTGALRTTLERMVDFDRIHEDKQVRLTVGATNVDTGNFEYFDSSRTRIGVEHIMASGALPPAFAPVRIGDKAYWDRSEEHTSELQSLMRNSYAVFCLQKHTPATK